MKNNVKEYKGLSKDDEKYLKEFDNAIERGFFKDKLVKIPKKMKKKIGNERDSFKRDLMSTGKRGGGEVDGMTENNPHLGKKKVDSARDSKTGKFVKKEDK